ncbi:restriction endonuclease subunit S [Nostoc sp. UHCC 0870]|uniref:restriction endonuclease subunit S n=1 Tax=Nostoc sp. UHCC 0870 TaxID=2914041 RepID=UPI001EDD1657|nr:restriction endonuclease subunit S [Nostoc sp. UHCC 0870]UKP01333.1 restriction endonuclease subunit S [Nostoc sp. UHCC 0870]
MEDRDDLLELPSGWTWTIVREVIEIIDYRGRTPPFSAGGIVHLRSSNIKNCQVIWEDLKYVSEEIYNQFMTRGIPQKGDLLLTTEGPLGEVALAPEQKFSVAQRMMILRPVKGILLSEFLLYQIAAPWFQTKLKGEGTGTTVTGISSRNFQPLEIVVSPLNEQRRIVAKIEALKARSQRVKEELEDIPQLLDQFRQSVLAAAFRGDLTADWREQNSNVEPASVLLDRIYEKYNNQYQEDCSKAKATGNRKPKKPDCLIEYNLAWEEVFKIPQTWLVRPLGKVCTKVTDGTHDTPKTVSQGIPYITAQHIRNGFIDFENCFFIPESEHKIIYSRCNPEKGDVIIVNIGAGTATPALVNRDFEFSMKNIALLKPITEVVDGKYLEYYQLAIKPNIFSRVSRGGAQPFMSLNLIKTIPFKLSPLSEQKEIVKRVELLLNLADNIEQQYQEAKANIDQLDQSILAKAFRGELVPQDPDDEPASVLLERIRAERAKLQTKTAKKSTTKSSARRTKKPQPQQEESVQLDLGLE